VAGRWLYGLTALFCLVLAVLSFVDFLKARKGRIEEMTLRLPDRLKNQARAVVRRGQRMSAYVLGAFVTGLLVSLLELACTGQLYLPTIVFVVSVPALRARAMAYLLLYNLAFILPLGVVFALTYFRHDLPAVGDVPAEANGGGETGDRAGLPGPGGVAGGVPAAVNPRGRRQSRRPPVSVS
jgi:hypothetical protein